MKKITTIFERDWDGDRSRVLPIPIRSCLWVFAGEGIATRKLDGTCCMVRGGKLYKRRELRKGETAPQLFEVVDQDEETGKIVGWVPVDSSPENRWHLEAFGSGGLPDGTYELIGPKIQGNPERQERHVLAAHSDPTLIIPDVPREFDALKTWLADKDIEGVVFHHEDGRLGKIKLRDFGLKRRRGWSVES